MILKTKLTNVQPYHFLIILLCLLLPMFLRLFTCVCICMMEVLSNGEPLHISSQLCVHCHQVSSLKLAMVRIYSTKVRKYYIIQGLIYCLIDYL